MTEVPMSLHRWPHVEADNVPMGHLYVDSSNRLFVRVSSGWGMIARNADEFLAPSPDEKRYLRKSLGIKKGVRL